VNAGVAGGAAVSGNGTAAIILTGSQGAINSTLADTTGVTYNPAFNFNGPATLTVLSSDGIASDSDDITINVGAVNDATSFTKGADQTVNEDAPAQSVVGWATALSAGPANEAGQTLSFNVAGNTNPGLFAVGPAVSANGTLTYTLAANANGAAAITLTLSDSGGTANGGVDTSGPQVFNITANAVNDAPSFSKGADQTVNEDAPAQSVVGWATALSTGPANEAGQTLSFNVTGNTNPGLFAVGPAVSANGTLTYTLAPNANGAAAITLTLSDNGDTANGGLDTSAPQIFNINVAAVNDPPTLANPLADQNAAVGTPFGYTVPANSFADADSTLAHSASRADDTSLPAWLTFTPGTRAFSGTPTANDAGVLSVKVTASDGQAGVFDIFTITIPNNVINGTAGNDTVNGTAGYDTVSGLAGNDILNGLDGNDILDGGSGTDTLNGGNGDDAFLIVGADSSYDTVNGGSGFDVILGRTSSDTDTFRLTSATGIERIDGGGGTGVNVIVVGGGAGGTLDLSGVELVNILNQIYGGGTADTITDALGRDELIDGGGGNDTLNGLDGNDTLIGNAGNDTLNGGAGVDTLTGGTGDDVLAFQQGQAQGDTVQDFAGANAPGGDLLRFTGFGAGATLTYTGANNAWLISYGAQSETITLVGVTALNSSDYLFVG
jgi:Ca2+-binding RTX toxin-like protein